jgi:lysophospholipase L1-like esterase
MTTLVALGDSLSCGEGVGVRVPLPLTWTALLAAALPTTTHLPLARPGARIADVRERQLPLASQGRLVTLLAGLNDVARPGFRAAAVRDHLLRTVEEITRAGSTLLLGRLHDPTVQLWVPRPLRRHAHARVAVVNAAVDEAGAWPRVRVLDLDAIPELREPGAWAVDRVHPSPAGHAAIAAAAADVLRVNGWGFAELPRVHVPQPASPAERSWWMVRHGLPYLAGQVLGV